MRDGEDKDGFASGTVITARRLLLKPPTTAERDELARLAANPRVAENLAAAPGDSLRGSSGFGESFAVVARESGYVIGGAAFGPFGDRPASAELACFIGEAFWGRGFATEATQVLVDRVFADPHVLAVWCATRASNTRGRRVVEKCGFQFRGTGMARGAGLSGAAPVERFLLDRRNWESLKAWGAGARTWREQDATHHTAA